MSSQPSATPAQPASEPSADGKPKPQHLPDPAKVRRGQAPSPIKPIPPKPKVELPGVDTGFNAKSPFDAKLAKALGRDPDTGDGVDLGDGDFGADKGSAVDAQERRAERKMAAELRRGPDGKFLAPEAPEGVEPGEGEETQPRTPPPPEEFPELAEEGETLESITEKHQKLLQQSKSLQGQFKSLSERAQRAERAHEGMTREQHNAAKSAVGWKARADSLLSENEQLKSQLAKYTGTGASAGAGGGQPSGSEASIAGLPPRLASVLKSVDWKMYNDVRGQGDDAAAAWLVAQVLDMADSERKADIEKLREEFTTFRKPIEEQQGRRAVAQHMVQVFGSLQDINDDQGQPRFPELWDETQAAEVGEVWKKMGLPDEFMGTPQGVLQAILAYRYFKHGSVAPVTAAQPAGEPAGAEVPPEEEEEPAPEQPERTNSRSLRGLTGSRATLPLRSAGAGKDPASNFKRELRETSEIDNDFGFPTRKSLARRSR